MSVPPLIRTNFKSSDGIDLGEKLITKDYLLSVYPQLLPGLTSPTLYCAGLGYPLWTSDINKIKIFEDINGNHNNWKTISASKWSPSFAGNYHMAAIRYDGSLWTAGYNQYGQLGSGNILSTSYLNQVNYIQNGSTLQPDNRNWKNVYCGAGYTLAIKYDGTLWASGRNNNGQLGLGDQTNRSFFTKVGTETDWNSICAGELHSLALKNNGELYSWGKNQNGILGTNSGFEDIILTPSRIGYDYAFIDCSNYYSYAIQNTGLLFRWGDMSYQGQNSTVLRMPTQFGSSYWKYISCGYGHSAAIKNDNTLWSVGSNRFGGLGVGNDLGTEIFSASSFFRQVYNKSLWKHVSCGNFFTSAIKTDGSLWVWGNNQNGQLGNQSPTSENRFPFKILDNNCKKSACFAFGQIVLKTFEYI